MESKRDVERFLDNCEMGKISKRQFSAGLASVGLGTAMVPLSAKGACRR